MLRRDRLTVKIYFESTFQLVFSRSYNACKSIKYNSLYVTVYTDPSKTEKQIFPLSCHFNISQQIIIEYFQRTADNIMKLSKENGQVT